MTNKNARIATPSTRSQNGTIVLYHSLVFLISNKKPYLITMESRKIITEHIKQLLNEDCIYTKEMKNVFNVQINKDNIDVLESLINLLEIHEESIKQARRILELKQRSYIINYMAIYAKNLTSEYYDA